ncbi:hypothetical protein HpMMM59_09710 [Helicobacter pylori]
MFTLKFRESLTIEHGGLIVKISWRLKSKPIRAVKPFILNFHNLRNDDHQLVSSLVKAFLN